MATTKVYDLEGKPHEKETVDARECVAEMGWSSTPPACTATDVMESIIEGNDLLKELPFEQIGDESYIPNESARLMSSEEMAKPAKRGRKPKNPEAE